MQLLLSCKDQYIIFKKGLKTNRVVLVRDGFCFSLLVTNTAILCCVSSAAQRVFSQPSCLLAIILVTSMLLLAKVSFAFSIVAPGRVRVRPRIQAKSTWKSLRMSVQEYTSAVFT